MRSFINSHLIATFIMFCSLLIVSCNDSEFAGDNTEPRDKSNTKSGANSDPSKGGLDQTSIGDGTDPSVNDGGVSPIGGESEDGLPVDGVVDSGGDQTPGGGISGSGSDGDVGSQPNSDKEVSFGENKLFHVGDNGNSHSSCAELENRYALDGEAYFFNFTLLKENTTVTIEVRHVCGVDYGDTNKVSIVRNGVAVYTATLAPQVTRVDVPSQLLTSVGEYSFRVVSLAGSKTPYPDAVPTDKDDYVIGGIRVSADKPIRPGAFGVE